MLTTLAALTAPGCPRPGPYGSLVASRGASHLTEDFSSALRHRKGTRLVGLFTEQCLRQCPGFSFKPVGTDGAVHRFRWSQRAAAGSLGDDLYGQLHIYKRVDQVRVGLSALRFTGQRSASAELTLAVDGVLRDGAQRSDRGTLALTLRQNVDGRWKIDGFGADGMRTVVSAKPLFSRHSLGSPYGVDLVRIPSDVAAPGVDRGSGIAVADVDGDGLLDVFLPGAYLGELLRNVGKARFRRLQRLSTNTRDSGLGAVFGDADADGDPDLLVLRRSGSPALFRNDGTGRFKPWPTPALANLGPARAAAWLDANGDGRLDLLVATRRGVQLLTRRARGLVGTGRLPRGLNGRYRAICTGDLNADGRTDVVLVDGLGPVRVLLSGPRGLQPSQTSGPVVLGRSCAIADLDGDGRLDVLVAAVRSGEAWKYRQPGFPLPGSPFKKPKGLTERLVKATAGSFWLRNTAAGFTRQPLAGPASLGWDLAVAATDLDGDGRQDVVLAGGYFTGKGRPMDPLYFTRVLPRQLLGRSWSPLKVSGPLGRTRGATLLLGHAGGRTDVGRPAGLRVPSGVGDVALADLDRDGTPELLLRHRFVGLRVWRWAQPRGKALTLKLAGRGAAAAGATVTAWALNKKVTVALDGGSGGSGEVRLGLGAAARADKVEVRWPDGTRQVVQDLTVGKGYTIHRGAEDPVAGLGTSAAPPPTRPMPRPQPPARPGVVAGVHLGQLGSYTVTPVHGPPKAGALRTHFGKRATVLLLSPDPCKACPAYVYKLSRLARAWKKKGVAFLTVAKGRRPKRFGVTPLRFTQETGPTASAMTRLLLLDATGRVQVVFLSSLPAPLVLAHHLTRLTAQ